MRNNRLLPYETIVKAASGEPEAVGAVLQYYEQRIRYAALSGELRGAAADLAALKFEVLQKVGEAIGDTQAYQL